MKKDYLNPETDTLEVGFRSVLLQVRDGMNCQKDMAPDDTVLIPMAFTSESLSSAKPWFSNIERESLSI